MHRFFLVMMMMHFHREKKTGKGNGGLLLPMSTERVSFLDSFRYEAVISSFRLQKAVSYETSTPQFHPLPVGGVQKQHKNIKKKKFVPSAASLHTFIIIIS